MIARAATDEPPGVPTERLAAKLLALCRGEVPQDPEDRGASLAGWAARHEVAGLCYHRLVEERSAGGGPNARLDSLRDALRPTFALHVLRNRQLEIELAELGAALHGRGIRGLVLKGPWMAKRAYPHPGCRPVGDVDLCIHEHDFAPAVEALDALDYRAAQPLPDTSEAALWRAHFRQQIRFEHPRRRMLELHFRLVNFGPPGAVEDWLWDHAEPLDPESATSLDVPDPVAMLFHLTLHAGQHGFCVLRLLWDVHFMVQQCASKRFDFDRLHGLVRSRRVGPAVYHALDLARVMTGAEVPSRWLDALRPGFASRTRFRWVWNTKAVTKLRAKARSSRFEAARFYLHEMDSLSKRLRYVRELTRVAGGGSC